MSFLQRTLDTEAIQHKQSLQEKYHLPSTAKFDYLYSLAYEWGHAYGFDEVENYVQDMLPLIGATSHA